MDINEKVANLFIVAEQLCSLFAAENTALTRRDINTIRQNLDSKDRLSRAYEKLVQSLASAPEELNELPEADRDRIRNLMPRLEKLARQNGQALNIQIRAHECVIKHVAAAAKEASKSRSSYNRNGTTDLQVRGPTPAPKTVTLDRVL